MDILKEIKGMKARICQLFELTDGFTSDTQRSSVATNFARTSSTTLTNVTGLTADVTAGKTYKFEAILYTTSNVAAGIKAAISGTATATDIIYEGYNRNASATTGQTRASALATAVSAVTAVTVAVIYITGTITVNAAGTLTVQFGQNVSNAAASTVLRGSTFIVEEIV